MLFPMFATSSTRAVAQLPHPPTWSPYGPWEKNLNLTIYTSPTAAQSAFTVGNLDILDVNTSANAFCGNANFACTSFNGNNYVALEGYDGQTSLVTVEPNDLYQCQGGFATGCGFWSMLNMRQMPNYVPPNPSFVPGGGNAELIRRSLTSANGVDGLNPFASGLNPADLETLSYVYDSLVKENPFTPSPISPAQIIDWMVTSFTNVTNGNVVSQNWRLRNDLFFHNGNPVTSQDVCFTINQYATNFPTSTIGSTIPSPSTTTCVPSTPSSFRVTTSNCPASDPSCELAIGMLPILPVSIWQPCVANPATCRTTDPMATGSLIGSGPWVCLNPNNNAGGPCSVCNGTLSGVPLAGGCTIRLHRYDLSPFPGIHSYMRCCPNEQGTSLHKFNWADSNDDGCVDIADLAALAIYNTRHNGYGDSSLYGTTDEKVDIGELSTVALYQHHCLTAPFAPSAVSGMDQTIDPFLFSTAAGSFFFIGLHSTAPGQAEVELAPMPGSPPITTAQASGITIQLNTCTPTCPTGSSVSQVTGALENPFTDEIVTNGLVFAPPGQYSIQILNGFTQNPFLARIEGQLS